MRRWLVPLTAVLLVGCVDRIPPPLTDDDDSVTVDDDDTTAAVDDDDTTPPPDDDDVAPDDDDTTDDDDVAPDDDDVADDDDLIDDDDATWTPSPCPCPFGQICVASLCAWAPTFAVGMFEATTPDVPYAASAAGCFWTVDFLGGPVIANEGECQVAILQASSTPTQFFSADAGTVTVTGGVLDPIVFASTEAVECLADNVGIGDDLFEAGQAIHFAGTGGFDFPAFETDVTAPSSITGVPGLFTIGADLTMAWNAGWSNYVELLLTAEDTGSGNSTAITCRVPDNGGFVIPGSMTGWLPASNDGVVAVFSRTSASHLEYAGGGFVIDAVLQSAHSVELP